MSEHTPGPWRIENDSEDYLRVIADGVQYPIADLELRGLMNSAKETA